MRATDEQEDKLKQEYKMGNEEYKELDGEEESRGLQEIRMVTREEGEELEEEGRSWKRRGGAGRGEEIEEGEELEEEGRSWKRR